MSELLPCPFCGKSPSYDRWGLHEVRCDEPGCVIAVVTEETFEEASRRWNSRAALPPSQEVPAQPQREREAALEAAALEFIAKVDRGEARSKNSYAAFKAALAHSRPDRSPPDEWDALRGAAPNATGDLSSEEFVRRQRDEWDENDSDVSRPNGEAPSPALASQNRDS